MSRFKPTTLIALDPYAAAFTQGVCQQLERDFPSQRELVQTPAVVYTDKKIALSEQLATAADFRFDLQQKRDSQVSTRSFFNQEAQIQPLKQDLIKVLRQGKDQSAIASAQAQGIEVSQERRLYVIVSAVNAQARGIIQPFAQLIRWLFNKLLTSESYTLEAVILMPGLFADPAPADYAAAYALLKELEPQPTPEAKPIFENHWLLDSCNAQGIQMGCLPDALVSYADAFVGFLTAEAEPVRMLVNTKASKGKMSAYSTFGYGELVFPKDVLLTRLRAALGRDILQQGFLAEEEHSPDHYRRLLLEAKQLITSDEYTYRLRDLEQPQGKHIWQDFNPKVTFRSGMAEEYLQDMQYQHSQFQSKSLLGFKNALEQAKEQVKANLADILAQKIKQWVDSTPTGFNKALQLLAVLSDPMLAPQGDLLGESPQNLITHQQDIAAHLDSRLEVIPNTEKSQVLLAELQDLRSQLKTLEELAPDAEELAELRQTLKNTYEDYASATKEEENLARKLRREAITKTQDKLNKAVQNIEEKIRHLHRQLETAKESLDEVLTEKREVLMRRLVLHLAIIAIVFLLIAIPAVWFEIWSAIAPLFISLCGLTILIWGVALGLRLRQLSRELRKLKKQIASLNNSLKAEIAKLRIAHNDQLKFEYELYVQKLREGIIKFLIQQVKQNFSHIKQVLRNLKAIRDNFVQKQDKAIPQNSITRRSLISVESIDTYYQQQVANQIPQEVTNFTSKITSRSQALHQDLPGFSQQLDQFCRQHFQALTKLSMSEVLFHTPDLMDAETAQLQLRQLSDAAEPLLQLQQIDVSQTQSRDYTLGVADKDSERILDYFAKIYPQVTPQITNNSTKLQLLSRCIGFPAYCLSSIEFYEDCYAQVKIESANQSLPDLIPLDDNLQEVWRQVLIAIALNLITRQPNKPYTFQGYLLGVERRQIADSFANDFTKQSLYTQFCRELNNKIQQETNLYSKLQTFQEQELIHDQNEQEILTSLLQDYNPLN